MFDPDTFSVDFALDGTEPPEEPTPVVYGRRPIVVNRKAKSIKLRVERRR